MTTKQGAGSESELVGTHVIAPFVSGAGERAQETAYNHELIEEERDEDEREWQPVMRSKLSRRRGVVMNQSM